MDNPEKYIITKWNEICDIVHLIINNKNIYDIFNYIKDELLDFNHYLLYSYIIDSLYRIFSDECINLSPDKINKKINKIMEPFQELYFANTKEQTI